MKKLLTVVLLAAAGFAAWQYPSWNAARQQLVIAEERVDAVVADGTNALRLDDLPQLRRLPRNIGEAENLVYLYARGTNIGDISGIETLGQLQQLDLNFTRITDLGPLSGLPALRLIYMQGTWVEDLSPLVTLPSLEILDIGQTQLATLEPVTRIAPLRKINFYKSYALDGSNAYYQTLVAQIPEISGGNSYRQNYRPGWQYLATVRFSRLKDMLGLSNTDA